MKFKHRIRINSLSLLLVITGTMYLGITGIPSEKVTHVDQSVPTDTQDSHYEYKYTVFPDETVYIKLKGGDINLSVTISFEETVSPERGGTNAIYQYYDGSSLNLDIQKYFEKGGKVDISISTDMPSEVDLMVYTQGSMDNQIFLFSLSLLSITIGVILELFRRVFHPKYFEDETRSIVSILFLVPLYVLFNFLSRQGSDLSYSYRSRTYYRDLHVQEVAIKIMTDEFAIILFYVLVFLAINRYISTRRTMAYKVYPINHISQYFVRFGIWSAFSLLPLIFMFTHSVFSRQAQYPYLDILDEVYIPALFLIVLTTVNIVLLHMDVLDLLGRFRFSILLVPMLLMLSLWEVLPPIPIFEYLHNISKTAEYHPVPVNSLFTQQLTYTLILLVVGVLNRMRRDFDTTPWFIDLSVISSLVNRARDRLGFPPRREE